MLTQRAPFPSGIMDCILPPDGDRGGLFLSGIEAAMNVNMLNHHQIGAVLTVGTELANLKFQQAQKIICLHDIQNEPIRRYFEEAIQFINEQRNNQQNVLVHCFVGVSRSATIVIAYLMQTYNYTYNQGLNYALTRRPLINPNPGFIQQLQQYEAELMRVRLSQHRPHSIQPSEVRPMSQMPHHRATTVQNTPLRRVATPHNMRQSIQLTPDVRRVPGKHMGTPKQQMHLRASTTQEHFHTSHSTMRESLQVLKSSNKYNSARKQSEINQVNRFQNAKVFCHTFSNTSSLNSFKVLLKTAGSGLGQTMTGGRVPIKAQSMK